MRWFMMQTCVKYATHLLFFIFAEYAGKNSKRANHLNAIPDYELGENLRNFYFKQYLWVPLVFEYLE